MGFTHRGGENYESARGGEEEKLQKCCGGGGTEGTGSAGASRLASTERSH